jgi:hypothetical protein
MHDTLTVKGKLHIVLRDENGNIKEERKHDNLVVTSGLTHIASRVVGTTQAVMSHMALGTGTNPADADDVELQTELVRVALDTPMSNAGSIITAVATYGAGTGTGALTEAGIFNASTAGTMLCRTSYAVINKGSADTMTITWTITIA